MALRDKIAAFRKAFMKMDFNALLTVDNFIANAPYFLFLVVLAMVYIGNTHTAETTMRQIDKTKAELKEVRWNFSATKSDLMYKSKQTEVARAVEGMGLKEITSPPKKIEVTNEHER